MIDSSLAARPHGSKHSNTPIPGCSRELANLLGNSQTNEVVQPLQESSWLDITDLCPSLFSGSTETPWQRAQDAFGYLPGYSISSENRQNGRAGSCSNIHRWSRDRRGTALPIQHSP